MRLIKPIIILIIVGVLSSTSVSLAGNRAVWIEGEVTRTPWMAGSYYMIEVDWKPYTLLADTIVTHRYLRNKGAYDEKISSIHSILLGRKIMMKVRKKEVIQIILF